MKVKNQYPLQWFHGSFIIGVLISLFALGAMIYEYTVNHTWNIQSLNQHLAFGLLFIYFSGRPMADERVRFLKYQGLAIAFVITFITLTVFNYLSTYPDPHQQASVSSNIFALLCLVLAFLSFYILKARS